MSVGFDLILNFKTKSKRTGEDHLHLHLHFLALCTILSFTSASFSFLLATSTTFTLRGSRREKLPAFPNKSRIWVSNPFSCKQLGHWSTCNISLESVRGRWFTGCWVWGTGAQGCSKLCHCIDSPQIASYSFTVLRDREAASFSEKRPTNSSGGSRDERKLEIVLCHCPFFLLPVIINNNHHFSPMLMSALRVYKSCWSVFFFTLKTVYFL